MDGLTNLYHKLSVGGFIIVDDWGAVPGCQRAVIEFREKYRITENIEIIDWTGVYWRKEKDIE
jgi:O-methyltransferase